MGKRVRLKPRRGKRRSAGAWWLAGLVVLVLVGGAWAVSRSRQSSVPEASAVAVRGIEHVHGLAVGPANPAILWIGTHGGLIRVTNGQEWMRIGRQGFDMMGFNVHPTEPNVLVTSGHPGPRDPRRNPLGVQVSRDGGQTWQTMALPGEADFHTMTMSKADPRVLYAWNVSGRMGLYRSRDGGRRWEYLGDRGLERVFSLAAHPRDAALVFAGTARGLYVSRDGAESWQSFTSALLSLPITAVEIHPKDPRIAYVYAAKPDLGLLRTTDGGNRWTPVGFVLGQRDAVGNLALDPSDPQVIYFATFGGDLYRSPDGGMRREQWVSGGQVVVP
ncbi:MAG: hypothetical protein HY660_03940 [Armatimonadetes bacterium]|nr:hypothetical protein [Armatimonadota bacterium]